MRKSVLGAAALVSVVALSAGLGVARAEEGDDGDGGSPHASHVLLISVDGMHESDLHWYAQSHPGSTLAALLGNGVDFTKAQTTVPSDSFPGMNAQVTGAMPGTMGIYYDDSWNHSMFPAGTTACTGPAPGVEVTYFEQLDKDQSKLDAGQGVVPPDSNILAMTGNPDQVIDPTQLPVDPKSCQPVYPHEYIQVNDIFEVAHNAGLHTAWSDKHPAYEILNGPSGTGVDDLFTPEINSDNPGPPFSAGDWTKDNLATQQYDHYKAEAVLNWIDGKNHDGSGNPGTPSIFGMNFQTVSTAQKLPQSEGRNGAGTVIANPSQLTGGYQNDGVTPGPLLQGALWFINNELQSMVQRINADGLAGNTVIILSAKHGQSPMNPNALVRIPDGPIITALNDAWCSCTNPSTPLVAQATDDDGMLLWLNDRSPAATTFARNFLMSYSGSNGNNTTTTAIHYDHAGLQTIFAGNDAAKYFRVQPGDPRVPDVFGIAQYGVVYTGGNSKIAEHGGAHVDDLNVPLLVSGNAIGHHGSKDDRVQTAQIAPTILSLLGLDPSYLQAVAIDHTQALNLH